MRKLSLLSILLGITQLNAMTTQAEKVETPRTPVYVVSASEAEEGQFFVREWLAVGPFENVHRELPDGDFTRSGFADNLLASQFSNESTIQLEAGGTYSGPSGENVSPELLVAQENGILELTKHYGEVTEKAVYLFAWIESEEDQELYVLFSSDDSSKVWINGKLEHESWFPTGRGINVDREILKVKFKKGKNAVLVKVEQLAGGWGIVMRVPPKNKVADYLLTRLMLTPQVVESVQLEDGRWETSLEAALSVQGLSGADAASVYPDLPQKIEVRDTEGTTLYSEMHNMGDVFTVTTGAGGYYIEAVSTDGSELIGNGGFLLGHDVITYAQERLELLEALLESNQNPAYMGWLHYMASSLKDELQKSDVDLVTAQRLAVRLAYWQGQAMANADTLKNKRGIVEWAYLSKVDRSGQPFTIMIPNDYTPERKWPLLINMHGAGGNHGAAWGKGFQEEWIQINVNGRGPVGRYISLSEIDVLEVIEFVKTHWEIDEDQVHLSGGSMGGYGTFTIASRHPYLFASATPFCGNGSHVPTENMLHVPTHSVHSIDDMVVVVNGGRAAIEKINAVGGTATMDEVNGYGHAIHNWKEGNMRAKEWRRGKVRVPTKEVRRVVYTAIDESARGAYWATVEAFGPAPKAARIDARIDLFNGLYMNLDNVDVLKIDVGQASLNKGKPLLVSINSQYVQTIPAPLPDTLYFANTEDGWQVSEQGREAVPYRLHFPGGMTALYHGEAFMIVYGTRGDEDTTEKLKALAEAGSRMPRPGWTTKNAMSIMPYGRIPVKQDTDVTSEDIAKYNLILLGLPSENALVAQVADAMPIAVDEALQTIRSNDGHEWALDSRGFGLLHFNPKNPQRLIYWIGSATAAFYQADSAFFDFQPGLSADPDFLLMNSDTREIAAARCFDSHWQWESAYATSPLLTDVLSGVDFETWLATKLNEALGTNCAVVRKAVVDQDTFSMQPYRFAEEARLLDVAATEYEAAIGVMALSGEEFVRLLKSFNEAKNNVTALIPAIDPDTIVPEREYRIAVPNEQLRRLVQAIDWAPSDYTIIDLTMREALLRNE